jgi:hypothetical protein
LEGIFRFRENFRPRKKMLLWLTAPAAFVVLGRSAQLTDGLRMITPDQNSKAGFGFARESFLKNPLVSLRDMR